MSNLLNQELLRLQVFAFRCQFLVFAWLDQKPARTPVDTIGPVVD